MPNQVEMVRIKCQKKLRRAKCQMTTKKSRQSANKSFGILCTHHLKKLVSMHLHKIQPQICQKSYTNRFSGLKFYTLKMRKLRLVLCTMKQHKCINIWFVECKSCTFSKKRRCFLEKSRRSWQISTLQNTNPYIQKWQLVTDIPKSKSLWFQRSRVGWGEVGTTNSPIPSIQQCVVPDPEL